MRSCREAQLYCAPGEGLHIRRNRCLVDPAGRERDRFQPGGLRVAIETGNQIYACYAPYYSIAALLQRNDPLDAVWRESEMTLDFVRGAKFRDFADAIVTQQ